ncbi:signal peptidase I [Flagellimonas sp.]|uniref:signal peptidase I n=1 Tax=Flagellimonas sp. TaxID=2058762 RepID=UPI003B50AA5A
MHRKGMSNCLNPRKIIRKCILTFLWTFSLLILIKALLLDVYYVPSRSMENTISSNSFLVISKIQYGPKLPRTASEIPYFSKFLNKKYDFPLWKDYRIPGISKIKRNDVVLAENKGIKIIKRITGIPGDTLLLRNGLLSINSVDEKIENTFLFDFIVNLSKEEIAKRRLKFKYINYLGHNTYRITVDGESLKKLNDKKMIAVSNNQNPIYPSHLNEQWDNINYGPIIVPFKGMKIKLDMSNYCLYQQLFNEYEGVLYNFLDEEDRGNEGEYYTFKNDYYFLMGDNRMNSLDSRHYGFIPKSLIFGKAISF